MKSYFVIPEPEPSSPTWPLVLSFAKLMEHKLSLNRHKGDREAWLKDGPIELRSRIYDEYVELISAMEPIKPVEYAAFECADIANFAMMVTDRVTLGKLLGPQNQSNTTM